MKCTPLGPGTRCGGWVIAAATITVVLTLFHVESADAACTLSSPTTWTLGSSGSWTVNGNWTPATFPNSSGTNVCIVDGVSTVTLSASVSTASLQLASGNALDIAIGNSLSVSGPAIVNAGTITLNGGGATNAIVQIGNSLSLSGGGVVNMSIAGGGGSAFLRGSGVTLTNTDNTIEGAGFIGDSGALAFVNGSAGTLLANASGQSLTVGGGGGAVTNNGTFAASNGGTLTATVPFTNTGTVHAISGTINANAGFTGTTGTAQIDPAGTLTIGASSTVGTLIHHGGGAASLNLGTNNITVSTDYNNGNFGVGNSFNKLANVATTGGQILAAGPSPANMQVITGADITGGNTATPTLALGNVHVGDSTTYQIANQGTSTNPSLRGAIQTSVNGGNITPGVLTGNGVTAANFGPVAPGTSTGALSVTANQAGVLSGQAVHIANNFGNVTEQTMAITGNVYAFASPTVTSSLSPQFNFGVVQAGHSYTDPLTITNTLVANSAAFQEGLNASFGAPANSQLTTNGGTISNLTAGASNSTAMSVTLTPTAAGTIGGMVPINFASNGATTSGLGITALPTQNPSYTWTFSATVVNPANPSITPTSISFGNVRIGTTQQQALSVANVAGAPPQASLDAQISAVGPATSNGGMISLLAPGSTDTTSLIAGLSTATAGAQSGMATVALQSDSTPNGCTSNCSISLPSQNITVSGNVYRLANPVINTSSVSLAARVGATAPSQAISITNSSPDIYTEALTANFGTVSTSFSPSGSIATPGLAAQGTSTAMSVALNTGTAGSFSGTAGINFTSTGAGTDNAPDVSVGSGSVTLTGNVYTPAVANVVTTSPLNFGIVHVGDGGGSLAQSVKVQNGATATALNDVLTGTISTTGAAPFSGSGGLGPGLGPQASSTALQVGLATTTAGQFTGAANLGLASHDSQLADLPLATSPLSLQAQVNNYAALSLLQQGGQGSLSGGGNSFLLDFGNVLQNSSQQALLAILNDNPLIDQAFTDLLSTDGNGSMGPFLLAGCAVGHLPGGASQPGCDAFFDTSTLGNFMDSFVFPVESSNPSGYDQIIGSVTLTVEGDVVSSVPSVPEPSTMTLFGSGLGLLLFVVRRQRRR